MRKMVFDLYLGELCPEQEIWDSEPELRRVARQITSGYLYWEECLSEEEWKKLEKLDCLHWDFAQRLAAAALAYGFRLGLALLQEGPEDGKPKTI